MCSVRYIRRNNMKKSIFAVSLLLLICAASSSVYAAKTSIDGVIGGAYATDPKKWGRELDFTYNFELDPYFGIGIGSGLYWVNWQQKLGEKAEGLTIATVTADTNSYLVPTMVNALLRLPMFKESTGITPYLNLGVGYGLMFFDYSNPEFTDVSTRVHHDKKNGLDMYGGFAWQVFAGIAFAPKDSKVQFLGELGWRGCQTAKLSDRNVKIDMTGFLRALESVTRFLQCNRCSNVVRSRR